jgi:hypothetical protein
MVLIAPATVHDQSSVQESVQPDPGSAAASRVRRERFDRRIGTTRQLQQDSNDRKAELRSDSQANMMRRHRRHLDPGRLEFHATHRGPELALLEEVQSNLNPIGQWAGDAPARRGLGDQFDAGGLDHQPDASELPG